MTYEQERAFDNARAMARLAEGGDELAGRQMQLLSERLNAKGEPRRSLRSITVETSGYEFTHGRKPRGFGTWAFGPERTTDIDKVFWSSPGTYAQAANEARRWAAEQGYDRIYAQS
ncbi:MAG: hypothetical protein IKG69_08520 [Atopobiaceae bacterium]|nr:hypothetical protein [Atopobiaceae bacterium]